MKKNAKIAQELVEELQNESAYQTGKAFKATQVFLRNIAPICNDQEFAHIPAKVIKEWFGNYDVNYKPCLDALVKHGTIEIDRHYLVGMKTRGYKLTEKGARLMYAGQMRYLKTLFTDPELKRQTQKRESYHRTKGEQYSRPFLQYLHNGRMHYRFSQEAVRCIEQSNWPYLTRLSATLSLTNFAERSFVKLRYNEADTRCWHEFVGMKSELRKFFSLGDLKYRYVMDIRSCHPLFLAHYLVNRSQPRGPLVNPIPNWPNKPRSEQERERSERSSIPNTTPITHSPTNPHLPTNPTNSNSLPHYVGGNSDIQRELMRWNQLFSDPDTDPKTVLIRDLGYTREQAKAALNQTINGGKQYRRFIKWFKTEFPLLHQRWERTYKNKVGTSISVWYETFLMQDEDLYALATELGLHLTYEFDGCGIMCRDGDNEVLAKIQRLIGHIQQHSQTRWGIRPAIVVKTADGQVVDMRNQGGADRPERRTITPWQPVVTQANHTAASGSRRSSNRCARPGRKRRGSPQPSST